MKARRIIHIRDGAPSEAEKIIGVLTQTASGELVLRGVTAERVRAPKRPPTRPKLTLRDVAIVLHFEVEVARFGPKQIAVHEDLKKMFGVGWDDKYFARHRKRIRKDVLRGFNNILVSDDGPSQVMALLRRCPNGEFEGFACHWGATEAVYGRGTLDLRPDGFDLDLDPNHPKLSPMPR